MVLLCSPTSASAAVNFGSPTAYGAGAKPTAVAVADFNGDSDLDLAIGNGTQAASSVTVRLGGPGATFGPPTAYNIGFPPSAIVARDFNGDGDPDIAATTGPVFVPHVGVLVGGAGGSFGGPSFYPGMTRTPVDLDAADFNGDLDPDLAVVDWTAAFWTLLGGAGATFGDPTPNYPSGLSSATSSHPTSGALGDLNGDSDPEELVAGGFTTSGAPLLSVFPAGSGGTFGTFSDSYEGGKDPYAVATGDFNGDTKLDVAISNGATAFMGSPRDNSVLVRAGKGDGTLGTENRFAAGEAPVALAVDDFDLDGDPDLAVANKTPGTVSLLLGSTGMTFAPKVAFPAGEGPDDVAAGDFNRDGFPDLVVLNQSNNVANVLVNSALPLVQPSSIAFKPRPDHTESERKTVTLANNGSADLSVSGVSRAGPDASSFISSDDGCTGTTLESGETCSIQIRFSPLGTGSKTAELQFNFSGGVPRQSVALSGTGTPGPWLQASVGRLRYGTVPVGTTTATKSVALTNVGSAPMTISQISVEGTNSADFVGLDETCTELASLDPGDSCAAQLAFHPTATGGRAATLTITHTAPRSPLKVSLGGTGG